MVQMILTVSLGETQEVDVVNIKFDSISLDTTICNRIVVVHALNCTFFDNPQVHNIMSAI